MKVTFIVGSVAAAVVIGACGQGLAPDDVPTPTAPAPAPDGGSALAPPHCEGDPSDARSIPKFVTPLARPPVFVPTTVADDRGGVQHYTIDVRETEQQVLPIGCPKTKVWAYGGAAKMADGTVDPAYRAWPGATFEATRGVPVRVTWTNALAGVSHMFPVDPTLHWADPDDAGMPMAPFAPYPPGYPSAQATVPLVTHLHGGEVASASDGFPLAFVTPDGKHGPAYGSVVDGETNAATYLYPNGQPATTLWYHDHALGITRLNVMAGLAGFYLLRDPADPMAANLPSGEFDVPLAIQDRTFLADGSLAFPSEGVNPEEHPYWTPEFFGDVIVVNGRTWPNLDVQPRAYRLRLLNGSNARFYHLRLVDEASKPIALTQIATDGGYLPKPVGLEDLLLGPGERADVIVDFSGSKGHRLRFVNDAKTPYPSGDAPDPRTTGQVMQFSVADAPPSPPSPPSPLPEILANVATLTPDQPARVLTLLEVEGKTGPVVSTLNGQHWDAPTSELPRVGATEDWQIVNLTEDAHTVHLHLVQFQLVSRQPIDADKYEDEWTVLNGSPTFPVTTSLKPLDPAGYTKDAARGPNPNELGWKDTLVVMPGEVTTIRIRVAPTDTPASGPGAASPGANLFSFDPTVGPGYVWHCHILDHEDNEMMRPMAIQP